MKAKGRLLFLAALLFVVAFDGVARTLRVGVVLPLKENTSRGEKMVEFYRGFLLAVDSVRKEGTSVEIQTYHSGATADEMDKLLAANDLSTCQMIIGPLDAAQLPRLTDYCQTHDIHLVVPFSTTTAHLDMYSKYHMVSAARYQMQQGAVWYLSQHFADCKEIIVNCQEKNTEGAGFVEFVKEDALQRGKEVATLKLPCDSFALKKVLSPTQRNLIILDHPGLKALNVLLPSLKEHKLLHPETQICLLGYPQWQTLTAQLLSDFYALDTYVYSSFYANPLIPRQCEMDKTYMKWFHTPMTLSFPCYCLMGFDLGYYFLQGLQQYGDDFDASKHHVSCVPYQNPLWFERHGNEGSALVNNFVELIHYTPNQTIELITRNR